MPGAARDETDFKWYRHDTTLRFTRPPHFMIGQLDGLYSTPTVTLQLRSSGYSIPEMFIIGWMTRGLEICFRCSISISLSAFLSGSTHRFPVNPNTGTHKYILYVHTYYYTISIVFICTTGCLERKLKFRRSKRSWIRWRKQEKKRPDEQIEIRLLWLFIKFLKCTFAENALSSIESIEKACL